MIFDAFQATKLLVLAATALGVAILGCSPAHAASIKEVFEKHGLIGTFAWDCSKQPSGDGNWYFVNRVMDADHVQRDYMTGPTQRAWYIVLDKAEEINANE